MTESFTKAKQIFDELESLIAADGFRFGDLEEDKVLEDGFVLQGGLHDRYKKVSGNQLIYAARQGFGCAVIPQDEIWVYDAKEEVLRAVRSIPSQGIFQMAVAEGVTKHIFQRAGNGYREGSIPDWREPFLDGTHIHWLAEHVPVTSYTWLSPTQENPVMTVLEDGRKLGVDSVYRTPKEKPSMSREIAISLGRDPDEDKRHYEKVEVDIYPGEEPKQREGSAFLWTSQELADDFVRKAQDTLAVTYKSGKAVLTVDGHEIRVPTNVEQQVEKMTKAGRLALGVTQKAIGSRLLSRLRPNR